MLSLMLDQYIAQLRVSWKLLENEQLKFTVKEIMTRLSKDADVTGFLKTELSLKNVIELYRDQDFGFILTAYTEKAGQYRVPHNHGEGWVVYTVFDGVMEMGSYEEAGTTVLKKSSYQLGRGDSRVYRPGDIHDTRCLSDEVFILRFTNCDLKTEESRGRMKRYPLNAGGVGT